MLYLISIALFWVIHTKLRSVIWKSKRLDLHYRRFKVKRSYDNFNKAYDIAFRVLFTVLLIFGLMLDIFGRKSGLSIITQLTLIPTGILYWLHIRRLYR